MTNGEMKEGKEHIQLTNAGKILILVKVFLKGERHKDWERLRDELANINCDYNELLCRHEKIHRRLFHSANLKLSRIK